DDEEEAVARGVLEALHVEDRVIWHREAVQREHAEDRPERGEQDRALERDRDPRRPRVVRLPADVQRMADDVRVPAHEESAGAAVAAGGAGRGWSEPLRAPPPPPRGGGGGGRGGEGGRARAPHECSSECACASGRSVRISKIEIIGRNRTKSARRKQNRPIEP